jgi:hypothetical protein
VGISAGVAAAMREAAGTAIVAKAGPPATAAELETVIAAAGDDALLRLAASVHDLVSLGRAEEAKRTPCTALCSTARRVTSAKRWTGR